jgi:hypothetical protein
MLERITPNGNRDAVPIGCVNPHFFNRIDQIHLPAGSPAANPSDRDLD